MNSESTTSAVSDAQLVKQVFINAVTQALNNLSEAHAAHVRAKLLEMLGQWNLTVVVSKDYLATISEFIFGDETLRTWLFHTKFVFFMNLGPQASALAVRDLIYGMACAASEDMDAKAFLEGEDLQAAEVSSAIPEAMLQELPTARQIRVMLAANTWMLVILLAFSFLDLEHPVLATPAGNKK